MLEEVKEVEIPPEPGIDWDSITKKNAKKKNIITSKI
jgi:hypothetical protein